MQELPVTQVLPEIQSQLISHNRLILQAPPGAGKTTLVPLALLEQKWLENKQIIMLEPRRLATRNAAARMAELLGEPVGETVGYQIRQDKKFSDKTRILVVTEGILTRKLQSDPELEGIGLVIFDEFHERNLHGDLSLAFCLQSQELLNESLKLLLMSATLNTAALAELLHTETSPAPVVTSEGKSYPVEIIYRQTNAPAIDHRNLSRIVTQQTIEAIYEHPGNILVFLPGVREIKQVEKELISWLREQNDPSTIIAPLYGELSKAQQDQAITAPPQGQQKIVLATNIAETSLTIEGITVVIDSGLQRESRFNPNSGMNALHTTMIAQDSADQRSGRAGRLSAGVCYRLWSELQQKQLSAHQSAEIMQSDLAPMLLELAQWGIQDIHELQWLDIPSPGHIAQAKALLLSLQAINETGLITTHGRNILALGLHPRLAHMILMAQDSGSVIWVETACRIAALLTEKDILKHHEFRSADITTRLTILAEMQNNISVNQQSVDKRQCQRVLQSARDFHRRLNISVSKENIREKPEYSADSMTGISGILLAYAYPDRLAKLRNNKDRRYLLSNGKGACFANDDLLATEPYLVIANLNENNHQSQQKEARIFLAAPITEEHIEGYFPDLITEDDLIRWNEKKHKVDCINRRSLGRLVLNEQLSTTRNSAQILSELLKGIRSLGLDCLPWTKTAIHLKQRIGFIYSQKNNHSAHSKFLLSLNIPNVSDDFLLDHLESWLLPHLNEQNSIKQLQQLNLVQILTHLLDWDTMQAINELAPEKIRVPSGSEIHIDYSRPDTPVLAVRLQELFGLQQTPAILNGSYPLLLHLLSPAYRPMQVTQDLASFWKNTYNEVKKELRGKYKKHYWPDDPLQAQATHRAKPRKS